MVAPVTAPLASLALGAAYAMIGVNLLAASDGGEARNVVSLSFNDVDLVGSARRYLDRTRRGSMGLPVVPSGMACKWALRAACLLSITASGDMVCH